MTKRNVLLTAMALGLTSAAPYQSSLSGSYPKFQYAGLSKHSPSHAQQKRDSKKAKRNGSK
jgi:hypothetical protein